MTDLAVKLNLSPGKHTEKYCDEVDVYAKKRYVKSLLPTFKKRRQLLKKQKTELRNKKELLEGPTYESDVALLGSIDVAIPIASIDENLKPIVVYFDLETGGFLKTADILQIAAKYEDFEFSVYIKPTQKITKEANAVNGLEYIDGNLQLYGKTVITLSSLEAMHAFYQFLFYLGRKCILTAHNCKFDQPRLTAAIIKVFMLEHYKSVVRGFSDTLPTIVKSTGKKGKGQNKLEVLANNFQIDTEEAHNAVSDVKMLEQVLHKLNISCDRIIECCVTWDKIEEKKSL